MISSLIYVLSIVFLNWGFVYLPVVAGFPLATPLVGLVFILRDVAQRQTGHWIIVSMLIGIVLSYVMASPFVALASAVAFALSEGMEWAIFTLTRRPFRERVFWSVLGCTPIDSSVFLWMIGAFSFSAIGIMIVSKLAGALLTYGGVALLDLSQRAYRSDPT